MAWRRPAGGGGVLHDGGRAANGGGREGESDREGEGEMGVAEWRGREKVRDYNPIKSKNGL